MGREGYLVSWGERDACLSVRKEEDIDMAQYASRGSVYDMKALLDA